MGDKAILMGWLDNLMLLLASFILIGVMAILAMNPPTKKEQNDIGTPGNLIIEAFWGEGDIDIDLWVQAPVGKPTGYSNKSTDVLNLLRDDRGTTGDVTGLNYENIFSRGLPGGEYIVNLHYYRFKDRLANGDPVPVRVIVRLKKPDMGVLEIHSSSFILDVVGQESTIIRFSLTENGDIIGGSLSTLHKPLRVGG